MEGLRSWLFINICRDGRKEQTSEGDKNGKCKKIEDPHLFQPQKENDNGCILNFKKLETCDSRHVGCHVMQPGRCQTSDRESIALL